MTIFEDMDQEIIYETDLSVGPLNKEAFERELAMCKTLSQKRGGKCNWGECSKCGVIPLLYKLHEGKLYESEEEVEALKETTFKKQD